MAVVIGEYFTEEFGFGDSEGFYHVAPVMAVEEELMRYLRFTMNIMRKT